MTWKDLTLDDCKLFRQKHPDLTRTDLSQHYISYYRAMRALGCLYTLYPKRRYRSHFDLTREDCERFVREHPMLNRKQLYKHHIMYVNAMKRLGCFDELWPAEVPRCRVLTLEDCHRFRREHPDMRRKELRVKHSSFWRAMRRFGCLDELYPARKRLRYEDSYLIERARKYSHVRDLNENEPQVLKAIYYHGIEREALKHMVPLGNKRWKMIYAYEFPDHSVYVGLTYDENRRKRDHRTQENSAVRRHIEQTGLQPAYRKLTGLLPVTEAQRMEGVYEEQYKRVGWTILNVVKTGGIGGSEPRVDRSRVIELFRQGIPPKEICRLMGIGYSCVHKILRHEGMSHRGISNVPIEVVSEDGDVIGTFPSIKDAAEHFGMNSTNLYKNIKNHWRVRGHYVRRNFFSYQIKHGKEPPEAVFWK